MIYSKFAKQLNAFASDLCMTLKTDISQLNVMIFRTGRSTHFAKSRMQFASIGAIHFGVTAIRIENYFYSFAAFFDNKRIGKWQTKEVHARLVYLPRLLKSFNARKGS